MKKKNETVLLPYISTWGWATWKEKWEYFSMNNVDRDIISKSKFLKNRFNLANYDYISILNNNQNSWGILWYYTIFIKNGLNVFPSKSLVKNIGFDGSGENCTPEANHIHVLDSFIDISIQRVTKIDLNFYSIFLDYFSKKKSIRNKLVNLVKRSFK